MLHLFTVAIFANFFVTNVSYGLDSASKPKFGPSGNPYAVTLLASHEYFQSSKNPAPDFWALIGYYVPQYSETACSAASLSMALNAARTNLPKISEDKLTLQPSLIEKTDVEHWKERLVKQVTGLKSCMGRLLTSLEELLKKPSGQMAFRRLPSKLFVPMIFLKQR